MPVSGQLCGTAGGGPAMASRFPVAFRRVGVRFGVILCPLGDGRSLRSAYQAQLGLDPNGVATFDTDQIRPGRVLPLPLAGDPRTGRGPLGFPLGLRTPRLPAAHAGVGTGYRTLARDYTFDINLDPPFGVSTGRVPLRVARLSFNLSGFVWRSWWG